MKWRTRMRERHGWRGIGPVSKEQQLDLFPYGYRLGFWTIWRSPKIVSEELRKADATVRRLLRETDGGGR